MVEPISICITSWNRDDLTIRSFEQVLDDPRVGEVVIVDDHSDWGYFASLELKARRLNNGKIRLYRNEKNLDCYRNKREAVSKATCSWVILLDSDNIIGKDYLDFVELNFPLSIAVLLQPDFAKPLFNFTDFGGMVINKERTRWSDDPMFQTMFNAMNFFVNRDEFIRVWDDAFVDGVDPVTSDSLYFNYHWLAAGNSIHVVPGLEYEHSVHKDSHYKLNVHRTQPGLHANILNKLSNLFNGNL